MIKNNESFVAAVDYGLTLDQMIDNCSFDVIQKDINKKNFIVSGVGLQKVELSLLHINRVITTEEVLSLMDKGNLVPARLEHLLAIIPIFSKMYTTFPPVIALGTIWKDGTGQYCTYFTMGHGLGRRLLVDCATNAADKGQWRAMSRFLVVRK